MGADCNTKRVFCSSTPPPSETESLKPSDDENKDIGQYLRSEDSTLSIEKAVEAFDKCGNMSSHDDELKQLKKVGAQTPILPSEIGTDPDYKFTFVWPNFIGFILLHMIGVSGALAGLFGYCQYKTSIYSVWLIYAAGQGVTMGAHRLWSHRSFKAKRWLKIILLYMHTLAGQNCLWEWVRDHRQHHKYSDTDADPHNANRGFWFSHVLWLCVRKHPKVREYGKKIDMSDLEADPYIMFQKKYYKVLYAIFALGLPTVLPIFAWGESPIMALWVAYFGRTIINLNVTWLVNSAAHLFGTRPYDGTIYPVENMMVALLAAGEGWHNYHHAFPWDYRAAELGTPFNLTCKFIDFFANYGVIYDRREATAAMVKNRCLRTGDYSHEKYGKPELAPEVTTLFGMLHHPLNPSYNSVEKPKVKYLPKYGYALVEEELSKNELDDNLLVKQNEILQKELIETDMNSNFMADNNNNGGVVHRSINKNGKSSLNIDEFCPGLATSAVTYKSD